MAVVFPQSHLSESTMRKLDGDYSSEVDSVEEKEWYRLLHQFDDANMYQTWAYGQVRNGRKNISHLLLKEQGRVIAIAQSRIVKAPLIGVGIAYVMWGPLWRPREALADAKVFRQVIRALRNEYVCRRGLLLRLYPILFDDDSPCFLSILAEEGFVRAGNEQGSRTIIMDLTPSLDELHKGIRPQKRRELKVAEKQLEIIEGTEDELFEKFIEMYKQMVTRKKFHEPNDINEFREIQRRLPSEFKMKIMLCRSGEGLCAGLICSAIGGMALYLFGATSIAGMKSRGSYLLQWKVIERLKENLVPRYDLHGINSETNPGTYKFKSDLAGDKGRDVRFLGRFESCESMLSLACVSVGERLKSMSRALSISR